MALMVLVRVFCLLSSYVQYNKLPSVCIVLPELPGSSRVLVLFSMRAVASKIED